MLVVIQKLKPKMKSITFCFFCQTMHSMSTYKIRNIIKLDHLQEWYFYINVLKGKVALMLNFYLIILKKLVHAFIGLQVVAERNGRDIASVQAKDIYYRTIQDELNLLKSMSYSNFEHWGNS